MLADFVIDGGFEPVAGYGLAPYVNFLAFEWLVVPVRARARVRAGVGIRRGTGS